MSDQLIVKRKDCTADGYAYLTKRILLRVAKAAGRKAAKEAMEVMGYVVTVHEGNLVKKWKNGSVEILETLQSTGLPENIKLH